MVCEMAQAPNRFADHPEGGAVAVDTVLPVAGNLREDQPGPRRFQLLARQPHFCELTWPEILDQRVTLRDETQDELRRLRFLQVHGDAALVARMHGPPRRSGAIDLAAPLPYRVTRERLDLDDVGAEIAE